MIDTQNFRFDAGLAEAVRGKRVLITGAGRHRGLGQAFALACGLNGAAAVGVHFYKSYEDALETVAAINAGGGNAFPVQADVTNTSDVWAIRSYVIRHMGGKPPNLLICNSGLSERGYLLGRPPRPVEDEPPAMRRARARQAFVDNLRDSAMVINTKLDGFLSMTHLWVGEAHHAGEPIDVVFVSSRQATDPGAGVPGYVLANFGVLALPTILAKNLGKRAEIATSFSIALPFVRTGMTEAYADKPKVFGRWQPRMLEPHEAARALTRLLARSRTDLDGRTFQLDVTEAEDERVRVGWSEVALEPKVTAPSWTDEDAFHFQKS